MFNHLEEFSEPIYLYTTHKSVPPSFFFFPLLVAFPPPPRSFPWFYSFFAKLPYAKLVNSAKAARQRRKIKRKGRRRRRSDRGSGEICKLEHYKTCNVYADTKVFTRNGRGYGPIKNTPALTSLSISHSFLLYYCEQRKQKQKKATPPRIFWISSDNVFHFDRRLLFNIYFYFFFFFFIV